MAVALTARPAARTVLDVISARTWLATIYLMSGVVVGAVTFSVTIVGLALSVVLMPVFLLGVPLMRRVLRLSYWMTAFERRRVELMLGWSLTAREPELSSGPWWRSGPVLKAPASWRQVVFLLLRLPVGVIECTVAASAWSLALLLITLPLYAWALPRGGPALGGHVLGAPVLAAGVLVGVVLLLCCPPLLAGLARCDVVLARVLIDTTTSRNGLQARIGELERSRAAVLNATEAERRRIERDLHDGAQQRLVALAMELGRARARLDRDPEGARALVEHAHEEAKAALVDLRNLVRGIHPPVLSDRGLDAALSGLAALCPVPVTLEVDIEKRPPATVEAIAYFVVAEALANVAKHSQATAAGVSVQRSGSLLRLTIRDDGRGGADPAGAGLRGLADRVSAVDGRIDIQSPPGGPTAITAALPCGS